MVIIPEKSFKSSFANITDLAVINGCSCLLVSTTKTSLEEQ